ncbi:MAG: hypothetical protein FWG55_04850 [Candidatus Bathyarchaeota archaeon]|nr:hypothetical protein [Candidatus Termiticorpusculum sp.]
MITVSMLLTLIPTLSIQVSAANTDINITNSMSVADIQTSIQNVIDGASSGDTITVTGIKTNENSMITLIIRVDIKVIWNALSKDLSFNIDGGGTFEVALNGKIEVVDKNAIFFDTGTVLVSGGEVVLSYTDHFGGVAHNYAIYVGDGAVIVSSGKVLATLAMLNNRASGAIALGTGSVVVSGGEVSVLRKDGNDDGYRHAIYVGDGTVTVSGGKVSTLRSSAAIAV